MSAVATVPSSPVAHIKLTTDDLQWSKRAVARAASINSLMWCEASCSWTDLLLHGKSDSVQGPSYQHTQLHRLHACSWLPFLWGLPSPGDGTADVVNAMRQSGLVRSGGLATTAVSTQQQWDESSSWAPLVCMWVDGLCLHGGREGRELGQELGRNFLNSVFIGLSQTGYIWEKYSSSTCGVCGQGGEYTVQKGFGWTNGTALHLLLRMGMTVS